MIFQFQQISNYGTATPVVARTLVQGSEILGFFRANNDQKESAKEVLHELQRQLIRCVEVRDSIASTVEAVHEEVGRSGLEFQSNGRAVTLPSVPDLQSKAEAFLQAAKMAIRETARLVKPFYGVAHDHRYQKFAAWAEAEFGSDDLFAKGVRGWEPWVKLVVSMRNAVDHPSDEPGGSLVVHNFRLAGTRDAPQLVDPMWGLSDAKETYMLSEMDAVIDGTIELGEEILVALFDKLKSMELLVLYEIPEGQRDKSCPIRLRVTIAEKPDA